MPIIIFTLDHHLLNVFDNENPDQNLLTEPIFLKHIFYFTGLDTNTLLFYLLLHGDSKVQFF